MHRVSVAYVTHPLHVGPEARLGLTFTDNPAGGVVWHQPVGEHLKDPLGRFATGGLAVLVDSGLGSENHRRRPRGSWTVTTELRLDLLAKPRDGSIGLGISTDHLGDDGHCRTTRGEVLDDDGRVLAAGLVKSMEIQGVEDAEVYDESPSWPSALVPGTLDEVLCVTLHPSTQRLDTQRLDTAHLNTAQSTDSGAGDTRAVEAVIAPEPMLANPLGNLHGGVFAAVAEIAGAACFPHEREVSSSSLDVRYVRQIPLTGPVTVRAEAVHDGRSWGIARVETRDERGRVCAMATVTVYGRR